MASLVDELLDQASEPAVRVSDLLRKAKVVAVKLRQAKTAAWIDAELTGTFDDDVPDYRKIAVQTVANFPYQGWYPVTEPTWLVEILNKPLPMQNSIRECEQWAAAGDAIYIGFSPAMVQHLLELGAQTSQFQHRTTPAVFEGVVDAVKTRVLNWALSLHDLGIVGERGAFSPEERDRAANVVVNVNGTMNFSGIMGQSGGTAHAQQSQTITNNYSDAARSIAEKLRDGATTNPPAASLLNDSADEIEAAATSNEPNRLQRALKSIKHALPLMAAWGTRVAAEHEIGALLDVVSKSHGAS